MNKKVFAKEWIVFMASFVFGILLPCILSLFFGELEKVGSFYNALINKKNFGIAWLIVLAPYLLVQIIRVTAWSVKQLRIK